jgi:hypothetical protein
MSRSTLALLLLALISLIGFGCIKKSWPGTLNQVQVGTVEDWMFCDECFGGEREAVAALGPVAVHPVAAILDEVPGLWEANVRTRYGVAAAQDSLPTEDSIRFVNDHLANFIATVQSRSAMSLGDIKTDQAQAALNEALQDSTGRGYRSDVIRAVRTALLAATLDPLPGTVAASADFLDTVWLRHPNGVPWNPATTVELAGAPFPTDVLVGFRGDSLGVVAAAPFGDYSLTIRRPGPPDTAERATISVSSFPGRPSIQIPELVSPPFPASILFSLSRATKPPDSIHLFRFRPTAAIPLTARAAWAGPAAITLVWADCTAPTGLLRTQAAIAGRVVRATGGPLENAQVSLEGTPLMAMTDTGGRFRLVGAPPGWSGTLRVMAIGHATQTRSTVLGETHLWIVMNPEGEPPVAGFPSVVSQGASPNQASVQIPAGACRQLAVVQESGSPTSVVVKLTISSP